MTPDTARGIASGRQSIRPWRYGLRALFFALFILSVWLASCVKSTRDQTRAVDELTKVHARVMYGHQEVSPGRFDPLRSSHLPKWLVDTASVDLFQTVVWVDLDSPAVTDETLSILSLLPQLKVLHVSNTSITDDSLDALVQLPNLEWLTLNTDLSDASLAHVGKLRSLRVLEISGAEITDVCLKQLYEMRQLERLTLEDTDVTSDGIEMLRTRLTNCEIDYWP